MNQRISQLLNALNRFNHLHAWSHNDAYAPLVMHHARRVRRRGGTRALDVGCGTGNLAARLAKVMKEVVGVEPDAATAALARSNLAGVGCARVVQARFDDVPASGYDLVTFVAVVHHLPLAETLRKASTAVRPGGRLVIVGLSRETRDDWLWSLVSVLLNPIIGAIRHPWGARIVPACMSAPTADPHETFSEIADVARRELPGVIVRRGLFWRYTAVWTAPAR